MLQPENLLFYIQKLVISINFDYFCYLQVAKLKKLADFVSFAC